MGGWAGLLQGLKPLSFGSWGGTTGRGCGKVGFRVAAPEGAIDFGAFAVCLKAYPDTTLSFSATSGSHTLPGLAFPCFHKSWPILSRRTRKDGPASVLKVPNGCYND